MATFNRLTESTYSCLHMYWVGSVGPRRRNVYRGWVMVVERIVFQLVALLEGVAGRGRAVSARVHGALMVAGVRVVVCIL